MQTFAGERLFTLPPEQLWPKLRDAAFLVNSIPDGTAHAGATRDKGVCTVKPGFSFAAGSIDITIEVIDGAEPKALRFLQKGKGIGATSEVETSLTIEPHEQGSKVVWSAEIKSLGGLLKMVPAGLIRGAANKVIEDVWTGVAAKIAAGA